MKWSVNLMDRKVEGTYTSKEETVSAVERLINEGYVADEIIIVTDEKNESELEDLTIVEVDAVDPSEGLSLWEKLKQTFSFGRYNSDELSNPLEEYGVEEDPGKHYAEALENGEIVILVNSAGPSNNQRLSSVTEEVLNGTDDGNSEDVAIIAAKEPTKVPTKEKMEPAPGEEEQFDPTKAQSASEDIEGATITAPDRQSSSSTTEGSISPITENENQSEDKVSSVNKELKDSSLENDPELTGDEATVVDENEGHVYPDNVSKGVVDGGNSATGTAHVNGIGKTEEVRPEQNSEQPESDAYYSNQFEEAGGKSIKQDEEETK